MGSLSKFIPSAAVLSLCACTLTAQKYYAPTK